VAELAPDAIYALLNWQAVPFIHSVFRARLGIPFIFHFKESPFTAIQAGYWPALRELVLGADGLVFSSAESRSWFEQAVGRPLGANSLRTRLIDGYLTGIGLSPPSPARP
jgi:hypothetical protein